jgi:uncharacterized protein YjeT (DUF2065 family)
MNDLLALLGLVAVVEGLAYFLFPGGMKRVMAEIPHMADRTLRLWGFTAMVLGLLLVYFGRR